MNTWNKLRFPLLVLAVSGQLQAQAAPQDAPIAKTAASETVRERPSVRVRILDPVGFPLLDAGIHASIWT
jgi:hypothetical protein